MLVWPLQSLFVSLEKNMAKQIGDTFIEGCSGNIIFYRLGDTYYARMKSSLSSKRVRTDAAFRETMKWAKLLGYASRIASSVYRDIAWEKKRRVYIKK